MSTYLQSFAERFATLDKHNLDLLNDLYSEDIAFRDPLHQPPAFPPYGPISPSCTRRCPSATTVSRAPTNWSQATATFAGRFTIATRNWPVGN